MWAEEAVFYQFYPLGMTGAPYENDGILEHRILKVLDWIPHLVKLGITAVYFSPIFESDTHGYNTRDYQKIDTRLGTNEDFKQVVEKLHENGIKVVVDGVFNHVGRGFDKFKDVQQNQQNSPFANWFHISFDGNSNYNDGFWYEGWEGNFDLVKLNLSNPDVVNYLLDSVKMWIDDFDIDGLRLDVAYMVDRNFLRTLRQKTDEWKKDFYLIGEIIGGDYNQIMNDEMCHSVTNYECRKGIFSALNSRNLFEIVHSLMRQFGPEEWTLYKGKHMISFVDNHDVSRITSELTDEKCLPLAYGFIFGMPGIPMVYYGSEWGIEGKKSDGDRALRPAIEAPEWNDLTDTISHMADARKKCMALSYGDFHSILLENTHCIFEREYKGERVMVAINMDAVEYHAHFNARAGRAIDLISNVMYDFGGGLVIPPYTVLFLAPGGLN